MNTINSEINNTTPHRHLSVRIAKRIGYYLIVIFVALLAKLTVKHLGFIFFGVFFSAIVLGAYLPKYLIKSRFVDKLTAILAWANLFTWLLPPLGLFTGISTFVMSNHISQQKIKFRIFAAIAIMLSVVNTAWALLDVLN